ncbi:di-heme-cytochrome C peroxidase [Peristeroidobacter soli]|uniref:di-heme-cytochrome C peroxidase n=1 Tax=Peristeroidobacter soli TaxID=2497877 RepID=UPI001C378F78|nr:di-heme-cytochrome C peroxidase [Peristeroidobacter soli]
MRRLFRWVLALLLIGGVAAVAGFLWFVLWPVHTIPALEPVDEYVWLDQHWGEGQNTEQRQTYYYTAQGTSMPQGASTGAMRYDWFVHLELPFSSERFANPDHMRKYRFLVDPAPSEANPDQLPIGFTKHFDPSIGEYVLDVTCAACHTGEIHYTKDDRTIAMRIDGGQAMHAFTDMSRGSFAPVLLASLVDTVVKPWKFDRFAQRVLGPGYPKAKPELKSALWDTIKAMLGSGQNNPLRKLYPVHEGFGRTDALGRIGNTAFGDHLAPGNYQVGDAPVSYPYLWNIWKFDWVQYNGSVAQPLARNIGEALGVGAISPLRSAMNEPLPADHRFRSSVNIAGLQRIEHTLQQLAPPTWPEHILGAIDTAKAEQGSRLFEQYCRGCHGPHVSDAARQQASAPLKPFPEVEWRIEVIPLEHIGTDPNAAKGFMERRYNLSTTGLTNAQLADALRPLLVRSLARDARFRLREVVRLRGEQQLPLGDLPALLESYPDPDANATPSLPHESFEAIDAALETLLSPMPVVSTTQPDDGLDCGLDCHTLNLLWDVRNGSGNIEQTVGGLDVSKLSEGLALNLVGILIKNRFYADYGIDYATQQCLEGFGALDLPQQISGYKPRPLQGVWATPPFLHNGSVPSLYQMLLPPSKRDQKFFVGRRDFDPVHVGYMTEPDAEGDGDGFWLDTSIPGNRNIGHGFAADAATWSKHLQDPKANPLPSGVIGPEFTDEQRFALVEYLKIHRDPPTPEGFKPPQCQLFGRSL